MFDKVMTQRGVAVGVGEECGVGRSELGVRLGYGGAVPDKGLSK